MTCERTIEDGEEGMRIRAVISCRAQKKSGEAVWSAFELAETGMWLEQGELERLKQRGLEKRVGHAKHLASARTAIHTRLSHSNVWKIRSIDEGVAVDPFGSNHWSELGERE